MAALGVHTSSELAAICADAKRPLQHRLQSCLILGQLRAREALPELLKIAAGEDDKLSWQALVAIGAIGSRRATRSILRLLRSTKSPIARHGMVMALTQLADERARAALTRIAGDSREKPNVRGLAAEALGLLRRKKRTSWFLIQALQDPSPEVRFGSLCAIGAINERRALPFVRELLNDAAVVDGKESVGERASLVLSSLETSRRDSSAHG